MIVMRDEQGFEATQSVGLPPSYGAHDPPKQLPPPPIVPQGNGRWKFSTMTKEEEVLSGQEYSYRCGFMSLISRVCGCSEAVPPNSASSLCTRQTWDKKTLRRWRHYLCSHVIPYWIILSRVSVVLITIPRLLLTDLTGSLDSRRNCSRCGVRLDWSESQSVKCCSNTYNLPIAFFSP